MTATDARIRQVHDWLATRGVGRTPTPGTVARGVELDHAEALAENEARRDEARWMLGNITDMHAEALVEEARRRSRAVVAPQLVGQPGRQFCRKGLHPCDPALTLVFFDATTTRLHWCAEHVFFAGPYRAGASQIIDHRGGEEWQPA